MYMLLMLDAETSPQHVCYRHGIPRHAKSTSVESTSGPPRDLSRAILTAPTTFDKCKSLSSRLILKHIPELQRIGVIWAWGVAIGPHIILNRRRVGVAIILNGPLFFLNGPGGVFTPHKPIYLASFATLLLAFD